MAKKIASNTSPSGNKIDINTPSADEQFYTTLKDMYSPQNRGVTPGLYVKDYEDYLGTAFDPRGDLDERRAINQSTGQLIKGFAGQLASEALLGMGEATGYAFDFEEVYNAEQQAQEGFDNWMSKAFREAKEHVQDEWFPVHQTRQAQTGSFFERLSEGTWWASQGKTFGTTLALMGPSMLVGAGATALTGGLGAGVAAGMIGAMTSAMFSRKAESAMEANNTFQSEYNKYLDEGKSDEEARMLAGETASTVFKANSAMLMMDFAQYATMTKAFAPLANLSKATTKAGKIGRKAGNLGFQMGSEAAEEAYQYIAQEEAIKGVREGVTPFGDGFGDRVSDYIQDPEFQTAAFMGALTGGVFTALGGVNKKATEQFRKLGVNRAIAASLGDVDSFNKLDNKNEANLLARAVSTNSLDKLRSTADTLIKGVESDEQMTPEERQSFTDRMTSLIDNADYLETADAELKNINPDYAIAHEQRKKYALDRYQYKKTDERIKELEATQKTLEAEVNKDPKELATFLNAEVKALESKITALKEESQTPEVKEAVKKLGIELNQKREVLDKQLEIIKDDPADADFNPNEYTAPKLAEFSKNFINLETAKLEKDMLARELAKTENKSKESIIKDEEKLQKEKVKRATEAAVDSASTAEEVSGVVDGAETTGGNAASEVKKKAANQEKPNYNPKKEGETTRWFLPEYSKDSPHVEAQDVKDVIEALSKQMSDPTMVKLLESSKSAKDLNEKLAQIYMLDPDVADEMSEIVGKVLSKKQTDAVKEVNDNTEDGPSPDGFITDTLEEDSPGIITPARTTVMAVAPQFEPKAGKVDQEQMREPVDDPDFSYSFNNNPDSLPSEFEVTFEVNFDNDYNKNTIKYDSNGKIENPDSVQILVVHYKNGKRHTLAVLTNAKENMNESAKVTLNNLRNAVIEAALANKKEGEITKTNIVATSNRSSGIVKNVETRYPVSEIPESMLPQNKLLLGIVREDKESGRYISTPNSDHAFDEHNVWRALGSVAVWIRSANGTMFPARAFTKNFYDIKRSSPEFYAQQLKKIQELVKSANKDNYREVFKTMSGIFYAPYKIKFDKKGNVLGVTFTKNKVQLYLRELDAARKADKTDGTNRYNELKGQIIDRFNVSDAEVEDLMAGTPVFSDKYSNYNYYLSIEETTNESDAVSSAYSEEFERFLGDLIHQVDVNKINTTIQVGRKQQQFNDTTKHYLVLDIDVNEPFHSPVFNIKNSTDQTKPAEPTVKKEEPKKVKKNEIPKALEKEVLSTIFKKYQLSELPVEVQQLINTVNPTIQDINSTLGSLIEDSMTLTSEIDKSQNKFLIEQLNRLKGIEPKQTVVSSPLADEGLESMTQEEKDELSNSGPIDLASLGIDIPNMGKVDKLRYKQEHEVEDKHILAAIKWLKKALPIDDGAVKLNVIDTLLRVGNREAWGSFKSDTITIYDRAMRGVAFHEAFHAVFDMALSPNQQNSVLAEARKRYGNLSQLELEEALADEFMEYVQSMEYTGKNLPQKIAAFFRRLYAFYKYNLGNNSATENLFFQINTGRFRNQEFTPSTQNEKFKAANEQLNYAESKRRIANIANEMYRTVQNLAAKPDNQDKSIKEIIDGLVVPGFNNGFEVLNVIVYNKIMADYSSSGVKDTNSKQDWQFALMLKGMLNVSTDAQNKQSITIGNLGKKALIKFGQKVRMRIELTDSSVYDNDEVNNELEEESTDARKLEHWMIEATEVSRRDKVGEKVRTAFSTIPMMDSKGNIAKDDLGYDRYLDYNEAFATIIREISGQTSSDKMVQALKEFVEFTPAYSGILEMLENDTALKSQMWNSMQNVLMDYRILNEDRDKETGNIRWTWLSANRKTITNRILDDWRDGINDPSRNIALDRTTEENKEALVKFKAYVKELEDTPKEELPAKMSTLSATLGKYGVDITTEELLKLVDIETSTRDRESTTLFFKFLKQLDPMMSQVVLGFDPIAKSVKEAQYTARYVSRLRPDYLESAFRDLQNKTNYSHIITGYLTRFLANLKHDINGVWDSSTLDKLRKYEGYELIPWLTELQNEEFRSNFNTSIFKGISPNNKSRGIDYTKMTGKQLLTARLNAFFNNGKVGYGNYMVPVLAGSSTSMFIQAQAKTTEDALNDTVNMVRFEYDLIKQADKVKGVNVLENSLNDFTLFSFLNSKKAEVFKILDKLNTLEETGDVSYQDVVDKELKPLLSDYLDKQSEKTFNDLVEQGIIKEEEIDGKTVYSSSMLDARISETSDNAEAKRYSSLKEFVKSYVYNYVPAKAQILVLSTGTSAAYKNTEDLYKRMKEIWTPGMLLDMSAKITLNKEEAKLEGSPEIKIRPTYNGVIIQDTSEMSPENFGKEMLNIQLTRFKNGEITEAEAYATAGKMGYYNDKDSKGKPIVSYNIEGVGKVTFPSTAHDLTDGWSMVHPRRYREVMIGLSKATPSMISEFFNFMQGKPNTLTNVPYKPFIFDHRDINGFRTPYQIKNSESVYDPRVVFLTKDNKVKFPTSVDKLNGYENYASPLLAKMADYMDKNNVDVMHFASTFKVGGYQIGTLEDLDNTVIQEFDNSDTMIISETPDHYTDDAGKYGVQNRKLAISDISEDAEFTLGGKSGVSKSEIIEKYQDIISTDLRLSFEDIAKMFPSMDLSLNEYNKRMEKMSARLIRSLTDLNADEDAIYGVKLRTVNGRKKFNIPLFDPMHGGLNENVLASLFRNNVVSQKIKGGNVVMVSSVGLSDQLEMKVTDGRLEYVEVMLPWSSKEVLSKYLDANNVVDVEKIKRDSPELLDLIGYRIPTEDKYSMLPLRIKKFLPQSAGATIIMPREITTLTGADFDIDKIYLMLPSFKVNIDINKIKRDLTDSLTDAQYEALAYVHDNLLESGVPQSEWVEEYSTAYNQYRAAIRALKKDTNTYGISYSKIEYDFNKPPEKQSKAARDNAKIDIQWSIYTNKDTASKIFDPGNFDYFGGIVDEIKDKTNYSENLDVLAPETDIKMFEASQAADQLIGVFAIENTTHATFQLGNVELAEPILFGGKSYSNLSRINLVEDTTDEDYFSSNKDGKINMEPKRISRGLSMYLSAIVDDLKHLNSGPANINFFTINVLTGMRRLGFSMKTSLALINQPVIKDLKEAADEAGGGFDGYTKAYEEAKKKFKGSTIGIENVTSKMLWDALGTSYNESSELQYEVLEMFNNLREISNDLGKTTRALRADNTKRKGTIASQEVFTENVESSLKLKSLNGFNELWTASTMTNNFYKYGVQKPLDLMNEQFIFSDAAFKNFKDAISEQLVGAKSLSEEQRTFLNYELLSITASQFEFFDGTIENAEGVPIREDILKNFPKTFERIVKKYPELKEDYRIIKILNKRGPRGNVPIDRIMVTSVGNLKPDDRSEIKNDFAMLLDYRDDNAEKEAEIREFAANLVRYNYFAYGFRVNAQSFSEFIPNIWRMGLQNSRGDTYIEFLDQLYEQTKLDPELFENIKRQFLQHNYRNTFYVPRVDNFKDKEKAKKAIDKKAITIGEHGEPTQIRLNTNIEKQIVTTIKNTDVPVNLITVEMNDNMYLMELQTVHRNEGGALTGATYNITNPLGISNFALEYNLFARELDSIFDVNQKHRPKAEITTANVHILGDPDVTYMEAREGKFSFGEADIQDAPDVQEAPPPSEYSDPYVEMYGISQQESAELASFSEDSIRQLIDEAKAEELGLEGEDFSQADAAEAIKNKCKKE